MKQLMREIMQFCREYKKYCVEVGNREKSRRICQKLEQLCRSIRGGLNIYEPGLLLALMDAYEVTRDEGMLQEVLDVVSANIDRLEVSAEAVKLLAYCYYYVEEEECLVKAKGMLEELRRRGEDVAEAEKVLQNLIIYDL